MKAILTGASWAPYEIDGNKGKSGKLFGFKAKMLRARDEGDSVGSETFVYKTTAPVAQVAIDAIKQARGNAVAVDLDVDVAGSGEYMRVVVDDVEVLGVMGVDYELLGGALVQASKPDSSSNGAPSRARMKEPAESAGA